MGPPHPPLRRIQPRQHQGEDVEAALSVGLQGDAALLQQHGLGEGAEAGVSGGPQPPRAGRDSLPMQAGCPGKPGTLAKEGTVVPRDREMLLGAVREGLGFSSPGHGWLWRSHVLQVCKQEPNRAPGVHQGATFQRMGATPTVPPPAEVWAMRWPWQGCCSPCVPAMDKLLPGLETSLDLPPALPRLFNASTRTPPKLSCPPTSTPGRY